VPASASLRHMVGDMNRRVKGRRTRNAARRTTGYAAKTCTPPAGLGRLLAKRKDGIERTARGRQSRNRPANPLTCRASDLLCLDANAAKSPWFRGISAQRQKNAENWRGGRPVPSLLNAADSWSSRSSLFAAFGRGIPRLFHWAADDPSRDTASQDRRRHSGGSVPQ